jgi:hypothetical protein
MVFRPDYYFDIYVNHMHNFSHHYVAYELESNQ